MNRFKGLCAFFVFVGLTRVCLKIGTFSFPSQRTGTFFLALQWSPTFSNFFLSGKLLSVWLPLVVMVAFSIATLNVDGIRDDDKRARIFEVLRSLKYDFYLLQETHAHTEDIEA